MKAMGPNKFPAGAIVAAPGEPPTWWINTADPKGWTEPVVCVWELEGEALTAEVPFDEWNYILSGQLFIEIDGIEVEFNPGDAIHVPAGTCGHYRAPKYAKMFCTFGSNPKGLERTKFIYTKLSP